MKKFNNFILPLITLGIFSFNFVTASGKKDVQKINNMLIYDFYMNYELAERNGNLTTILDYFPHTGNSPVSSIKIQSTEKSKEILTFQYNPKNDIEKLVYEVRRKTYAYDFIYDNDQLSSVNIDGEKKITFGYNKEKLVSITRVTIHGSLELSIEYEGKKAKINVVVVEDGQKKTSFKIVFVTWNNDYRMTSYQFDAYAAQNLTYSDKGDMTSFEFLSMTSGKIVIKWQYAYDDKGNWTEKKSEYFGFNRTTTYK
jgi:hypothetical protein